MFSPIRALDQISVLKGNEPRTQIQRVDATCIYSPISKRTLPFLTKDVAFKYILKRAVFDLRDKNGVIKVIQRVSSEPDFFEDFCYMMSTAAPNKRAFLVICVVSSTVFGNLTNEQISKLLDFYNFQKDDMVRVSERMRNFIFNEAKMNMKFFDFLLEYCSDQPNFFSLANIITENISGFPAFIYKLRSKNIALEENHILLPQWRYFASSSFLLSKFRDTIIDAFFDDSVFKYVNQVVCLTEETATAYLEVLVSRSLTLVHAWFLSRLLQVVPTSVIVRLMIDGKLETRNILQFFKFHSFLTKNNKLSAPLLRFMYLFAKNNDEVKESLLKFLLQSPVSIVQFIGFPANHTTFHSMFVEASFEDRMMMLEAIVRHSPIGFNSFPECILVFMQCILQKAGSIPFARELHFPRVANVDNWESIQLLSQVHIPNKKFNNSVSIDLPLLPVDPKNRERPTIGLDAYEPIPKSTVNAPFPLPLETIHEHGRGWSASHYASVALACMSTNYISTDNLEKVLVFVSRRLRTNFHLNFLRQTEALLDALIEVLVDLLPFPPELSIKEEILDSIVSSATDLNMPDTVIRPLLFFFSFLGYDKYGSELNKVFRLKSDTIANIVTFFSSLFDKHPKVFHAVWRFFLFADHNSKQTMKKKISILTNVLKDGSILTLQFAPVLLAGTLVEKYIPMKLPLTKNTHAQFFSNTRHYYPAFAKSVIWRHVEVGVTALCTLCLREYALFQTGTIGSMPIIMFISRSLSDTTCAIVRELCHRQTGNDAIPPFHMHANFSKDSQAESLFEHLVVTSQNLRDIEREDRNAILVDMLSKLKDDHSGLKSVFDGRRYHLDNIDADACFTLKSHARVPLYISFGEEPVDLDETLEIIKKSIAEENFQQYRTALHSLAVGKQLLLANGTIFEYLRTHATESICDFSNLLNRYTNLINYLNESNESHFFNKAVIVKSYDDVRYDQFVSSFVKRMYKRLASVNDVFLFWYDIAPLSSDSGVIEVVPYSKSRDGIGKFGHTLQSIFDNMNKRVFQHTVSAETQKSLFIRSLTGSALYTYLLNLKDRHNGNILLSFLAHQVHIDFGFIFDISPGGNFGFESAPFKLSREMMEYMGDGFDRFVRLLKHALVCSRFYAGEFDAMIVKYQY
ncbi:hypothetical protein PCE1_001594 [Barthelona sp. PCE]